MLTVDAGVYRLVEAAAGQRGGDPWRERAAAASHSSYSARGQSPAAVVNSQSRSASQSTSDHGAPSGTPVSFWPN